MQKALLQTSLSDILYVVPSPVIEMWFCIDVIPKESALLKQIWDLVSVVFYTLPLFSVLLPDRFLFVLPMWSFHAKIHSVFFFFISVCVGESFWK